MRVWRVEHRETRRGPYMGCSSGISGCASDNTPMPYTDGFKAGDERYNDEDRFGFVDLQKLKRWFDKSDRVSLAKHGYVCRIYDVPKKHVRTGRSQAIFKADKAKFVRKSKVIK